MRSLFFLTSVVCLFFAGCIKIERGEAPESDITVRGRLVKDCSLEPVAGATIYFVTDKLANFPGTPQTEGIGSVVTGSDGRFEIKLNAQAAARAVYVNCQLAGSTRNVSLTNSEYHWAERPVAGRVYNWGNVYVDRVPVYVNVVANIGPGLRAKDSLVIAHRDYRTPIVYSPVPAQINVNEISHYANGSQADAANSGINFVYTTSLPNLTKYNDNGVINKKLSLMSGKICNVGVPDTVTLDW